MQISVEKYERLRDRIAILDMANRELRRRLSETASHGMHWISVKDRLPEKVKPVVFVALEPDGQSACAWVAWSDQKEDALYWAELPELPEVEDGNGE